VAEAIYFFIFTYNKQNNEHRSLFDYKKTFFHFLKSIFVYNHRLDCASPEIVILYILNFFELFYILIMVPRTLFKKALLKRSRVVFMKFARKICLRYSKRVSVNLTHHYKYKDF
jgi:hypothetical protein